MKDALPDDRAASLVIDYLFNVDCIDRPWHGPPMDMGVIVPLLGPYNGRSTPELSNHKGVVDVTPFHFTFILLAALHAYLVPLS